MFLLQRAELPATRARNTLLNLQTLGAHIQIDLRSEQVERQNSALIDFDAVEIYQSLDGL